MYEQEVTGNYSIRARNLFFSASLDSGCYNRQFTDIARLSMVPAATKVSLRIIGTQKNYASIIGKNFRLKKNDRQNL